MGRYGELSKDREQLLPHQFCADCIIGTRGYDFREGQEAVCVTLALVRTSVLRPSQSGQLSEAIFFFRFQNRNACAARWRLSPAAHTGRPCDNTMRPATSADTASVSPTSSVQY